MFWKMWYQNPELYPNFPTEISVVILSRKSTTELQAKVGPSFEATESSGHNLTRTSYAEQAVQSFWIRKAWQLTRLKRHSFGRGLNIKGNVWNCDVYKVCQTCWTFPAKKKKYEKKILARCCFNQMSIKYAKMFGKAPKTCKKQKNWAHVTREVVRWPPYQSDPWFWYIFTSSTLPKSWIGLRGRPIIIWVWGWRKLKKKNPEVHLQEKEIQKAFLR